MAAERVHTFLIQRRAGAKPQRIVVWDTQEISAGRAAENDLVLEDVEASRTHACFCRGEGGYTVQHRSATNETTVNGEAVSTRPLQNKDVVRIAETEFVFYRVTQNPVTLGLPVEYASQLKGFAPGMAAGDGESTILGLGEPLGDDDESFVVRPARDFEHELHGVEPPKTRDLDLELGEEGLDELDLGARPSGAQRAVDAWTLEEAPPSGTLSLTLEVQGLSGPQRASIEALLGKVIELPRLRLRVKGQDLG